jgi:hypothetical protein
MRFRPVLVTLALLLCAATTVRAQGFGSSDRFNTRPQSSALSRPPVSPYVNLLRRNSPVLNYYGVVRPELDAREADLRLEAGIENLDDRIRRQGLATPSRVGASGHAARFMTDTRGQVESIPIEMGSRRTRRLDQQQRAGYSAPATGHSAYFGNGGYFYGARQQRQ